MDLNSIAKLLPEFLEMFKGKDMKNLPDILSSLGNTGMLEKLLGSDSKYSKYLPLLPLLGKLNAEGFKGLLNNSDSIAPVISTLAGSKESGGKGLDLSSLANLLPLLSGFINKDKKENAAATAPVSTAAVNNFDNVKNYNPLSPISDIADRDIIYILNKYISNN